MTVYELTPETVEQVGKVLDLWSRFNGETISAAELMARFIRSRSRVFLASDSSDKPVGFAVASSVFQPLRPDPIFELWALYVEPTFRRQGIGKLLLNSVEQLAGSLSCHEIHVSALQDPDIEQIYSQFGFTRYAGRLRKCIHY